MIQLCFDYMLYNNNFSPQYLLKDNQLKLYKNHVEIKDEKVIGKFFGLYL